MSSRPAARFVVLTQGFSDPVTAKTGASFIRYREQDVLAVLDAENAGKMALEILGAGPHIPVIRSLDEVPAADTLLIGTAPTGGRMPEAWRAIVRSALQRGLNIVSGLHDFLGDDPELQAIAESKGVTITDVRRNAEKDVSVGQPLGNECLRIHTMGNDCSLGKMVVTIELDKALRAKGHNSKFLATGQTGIMISGDGVPIDCVVADFVSGAAEKLVIRNQHHDILLIEGQGSLAHPMYSSVTLGLMHGCQPQGLILCYEVGRQSMGGVKGRQLVSLTQLRHACETIGRLVHPTSAIGVAMNGRKTSAAEAETEKQRVRDETGLPVCDVFRDGPDVLVQAIEDLRGSLRS
jgi:uncharacterized NAD-dependent epimerase/dehydratase family protein